MRIGGVQIAGYTYEEGTNRLIKLDYGNGDRVDYTYDSQGRVICQTYETGETVSYAYDNSGNLATVTDSETGIVTTYYYDLLNRGVGYREQGPNLDHSVTYIYDEENNVSSMTETVNRVTKTYSYTYDEDNRIISETVDGITVEYTYDGFGRLSNRVVKNGDTEIQSSTPTYSAGSAENSTTGQISSYNGYTYTYDKNGNILTISDGTNTISYTYDSANQLIWEYNLAEKYAYKWTYDEAGNIINRQKYLYIKLTSQSFPVKMSVSSIEYQYTDTEWGDLLTSYNSKTITYDEIGNPLNDGTWTYEWKHGRQLVSMSDGSTTWNYTYDANGMRTKKTDGMAEYTYVYNGDKLIRLIVDAQEYFDFYFTYDASGTPLTITENGYTYYYVTNLQGDVIGIKDSSGQQVVTYAYDAWGNLLYRTNTQLADYNPLRYRGYVYDFETGLYYLQSRYYNPEWGRFINADAYAATGQGLSGNNMFAYCGNNPVMYSDPCGTCAHTWYFLFLVDCDSCKAAKQAEKALSAANTVKYDVPLYEQKDTELCWSFCEEMVSSYNAGQELSQKEAKNNAIDRAKQYHGSDDRAVWNQAGVPTNAGKQIYPNTIDELYDIVEANGPVYAGYVSTNGGHMVVVTGVNKYKDEVYTNNPWGIKGVQSFEEFLNGCTKKWWQGDTGLILYRIYIAE